MRPLPVAVLLACFAHAASASAQDVSARDRFDVGSFRPAPAGERFMGVESPEFLGHGAFDIALVTDAVAAPLVVVRRSDDAAIPVVSSQILVHAGLALTFWDRLKVSADLPFGGSSVADSVEQPEGPTTTSFVLGDLRTGARVLVAGDQESSGRLALSGSVWLPTGDQEHFAGDSGVRGSVDLVLGGSAGRSTWGATTGVLLRQQAQFAGATIGRALTLDLGLGVPINRAFTTLIESHGSMGVAGDNPSDKTVSLDFAIGPRIRIGPIVVAAQIVVGLARGVGTPIAGGRMGISYAPLERLDLGSGSSDSDRFVPPMPPDPEPVMPEPTPEPSPSRLPDHDKDGIPDSMDSCPDRPGPPSGDVIMRGCPGDQDEDGVLDDEDRCPGVKGRLSLDPQKNGCPRAKEE